MTVVIATGVVLMLLWAVFVGICIAHNERDLVTKAALYPLIALVATAYGCLSVCAAAAAAHYGWNLVT